MSFSREAAGRRLPWLWLGAVVATGAILLLPTRSLFVAVWPLALTPIWLLLGHVLTSLSSVVTSLRLRRGLGLWRSSWSVYRENRSLAHLQAALLVSVIEELAFRGALQFYLTQALDSPWLAVVATSLLFAAVHVRPGRGSQARRFADMFLFAFVLGGVTALTSSLYPAIVLHAARNYILRCLLVSKEEWRRLGSAGEAT